MSAPDRVTAGATLVRPDELTFTVVSSSAGPLGKRYWLENGVLRTETAATLERGDVSVEHAGSIEAFAARLDSLSDNQALLYGIPPVSTAGVVTEKQFAQMNPLERQGVITRTRKYLEYAHAPGVLMLDVDPGSTPKPLLDAVASPEGTRALLLEVVPELADAPMLWRPSSSSYLYHGQQEVHGLRGQRVYIAMSRASDIPLLGSLLFDRLWLLGYGYCVLSASGQLLDRTLIDRSVWQPERLDFAAPPLCEQPLERRVPPARIWNSGAPFLHAARLPPLTPAQQHCIQAKRKAARLALRDAAHTRREEWAAERGRAIAGRVGLDEITAVHIAREAVERRILRPDFLLITEDGEHIAVRDLLAQTDTWHGHRFHDPLEPEYRGDPRIAWANLRCSRGRPYLYSHAHGGIRYKLSSSRKVIRLTDGELPRIVDECAEVFTANAEIYQLKDQLVRVTDAGRLATVETEWVIDCLQRHADFEKLKKLGREFEYRPTDLPRKYAQTLLAKNGDIGVVDLAAITAGPFVRPDGSVVDEPGYDEATQILYWPSEPSALSVRREMTIPMAEDALRHLWAPFSEFPLASDVDRGCLLALLLTAAIRPGIAIAPGGLIESHEAGSGKTLCAQAVSSLVGRAAYPQAIAQHEEEIRKSLFSAARVGTPSLLFDNVGRDRALDSASLAMALTSGTIADRILGESTYASVPFRSLILLTGNNARIVGDLNRRLLRVRINPQVEHPWRRVFDFCPRARTEANWFSMRVAAIELVQAALGHGTPALDGATGYNDWDRLVRATVCWIDRHVDIGVRFGDPARSLLRGYEDDPERDRLRRLLTAWFAAFGAGLLTVSQVLEAVQADPLVSSTCDVSGDVGQVTAPLKDVLHEVDIRLGAHAIGLYLSQQKGRIVDGFELVSSGTHGGSRLWGVRPATAAPQVAGVNTE